MERRRDLRFRDFSYQDLTGADFAGADLTEANFVGAILRGADLSGVQAERANFMGADLTDALLEARERLSRPAVSPNGEFLACQGGANRLWLWDLKQQETEAPLHLPEAPLLSLFFSPESRWLACLFPTSLLLWDVQTRIPFHRLQLLPDPNSSPYRALWKNKTLLPPVFSQDGRLLAVWMKKRLPDGPRVPCIRLWDVVQQVYVQDFLTEHQVIAFAPDNALIATGGKDLALWQRETGEQIGRWSLGPVRELTFHASGSSLFVLAEQFSHLDVTTGAFWETFPQLQGPSEPIMSRYFSPDGTRLLTSTESTDLDLWTVPGFGHVCALKGYHLAFSPDGHQLAITVNERRRKTSMTELRDPSDGRLLHTVSGWLETFSRDGSWLATATGEWHGEQWLRWNCQTGQQISVFHPGHRFDSALLSPDEQVVALFYGEEERGTIHVSYSREIDDEYYTNESRITVYVVESGKIVCPQMAKQVWHAILQVAFSWNSQLLALETATYNDSPDYRNHSQVEVWDLVTGERLTQTPALRRKPGDRLYFDPFAGWLTYGKEQLWFSENMQYPSRRQVLLPAHQQTFASPRDKTPEPPAFDPALTSLWRTLFSEQRVLVQRHPSPRLIAAASIRALPKTMDPRSHDHRVAQGLKSVHDTWQQLIAQAKTNATQYTWYNEKFEEAFQKKPQPPYHWMIASAYDQAYTCGAATYQNGALVLWQKATNTYREISWPARWSDACTRHRAFGSLLDAAPGGER